MYLAFWIERCLRDNSRSLTKYLWVLMSSILTGYFVKPFNKEHETPTVVSNIQQI